MPKITIITPTYNSSKFIRRTIDSVLAQTYTDWEFLLIDDHSTDNTLEIISEYAKKDHRIKILKTPKNSGGPALPKNIGIENAAGEYVAFLDHDDQWLEQKLEKQLKFFTESGNNKLGVVACYVNIRDSITGNIISKYRNLHKKDASTAMIQDNFIVTSSCLMTKLDILKEVGLFDVVFKVSDDWDMWLRILEANYEFDFIPEYLINYFKHLKNLSNNTETELGDLKRLSFKHSNKLLKIRGYRVLAYSYFNNKQYVLSRKYFLYTLFSPKVAPSMRARAFIYIILTFLPNLKDTAKKIFHKLK